MGGPAEVELEEIHFFSGQTQLAGTISWPATPRPVPSLVMIGGSGPSTRHNDGFFDLLGAAFVEAGVAVLAYDKRTTWETATVDELAADAEAAVNVMARDVRSSPGTIGVMGHSEGGWVGMRLCAQQPTVSHLILNSCPGTSFLHAELYALAKALGDDGSAQAARGLLEALAQCACSGAGYGEAQRLVASASEQSWYPDVVEAGFALRRATWEQLKVWGDYDPHGDLRVLTTPTLVVLGAEDPLVPVQASVASFAKTAKQAGRPQEIVVYPAAGHRLQLAAGESLAAGYLDALREWVRAHSPPR